MPAQNDIKITITASNQASTEFKQLLDQIERLQKELNKIGSASGAAARKYAEDQKTIRKQAEATNRLQVQAAKTKADSQKRVDEEAARESKRISDERAATTKHRRNLEIQDERAVTKEREESAKRLTEINRSNNRRAEATHRDNIARGKEQRAENRRTARESERQRMREINQQRSLQRQLERTRRAQTRTFGQFLGRGQFRDAIGVIADASFAMQGFGLALATVGRAIVTESSRFERLNLALEAVTGNAAEARQQLEDIQRLSRLPLITFRDASEVGVRLRAAGFDREQTERLIREFGNAAAASGALFSDAREALRQLSQAQGLGRFTAENFNIILERLPIVRRVALQQFGSLIGGDIQNILERQGKTLDEGIEDLVSGLEQLQRVDADSFENAVSNLGNDLDILSRQIGNDLLPAITDLVNGFAAVIRFFTTDFGRVVGGVITGALLYGGVRAGIGAVNFLRGAGVGGVAAAGGIGGVAASGAGAGAGGISGVSAAFGFGGLAGSSRIPPIPPERQLIETVDADGNVSYRTGTGATIGQQSAANRAAGRSPLDRGLAPVPPPSAATTAGRSAAFAAAFGVSGARSASLIGAGLGVLATAGPIVAFELFAQNYRDQAEAINELADAQARLRANFNERVFGGDKGLGQLRQYNKSLRTLQTTLSKLLGEQSPIFGRFGPGVPRGEQNISDLFARLNLDTLSLENARRILPQLETAVEQGNSLRSEQIESFLKLNRSIQTSEKGIANLRRRLEILGPDERGRFPRGPDDRRFAERFSQFTNRGDLDFFFVGVENVREAYEVLEKRLRESEDALALDLESRRGLINRIFGDDEDVARLRQTINESTAEIARIEKLLDALRNFEIDNPLSQVQIEQRQAVQARLAEQETILKNAREELIATQDELSRHGLILNRLFEDNEDVARLRRTIDESTAEIARIEKLLDALRNFEIDNPLSLAQIERRQAVQARLAVQEEILENAREQLTAIEDQLIAQNDLNNATGKYAEELEKIRKSGKYAEELARIRRIVAEADPTIRLIRTQRELSVAQFAFQRIESPEPAITSLRRALDVTDSIRLAQQRIISANDELRDAQIALAREEERQRSAKEKNEFLLEERIASIREQFRQANVMAEQEAAARIKAILDQTYAEIEANMQRAHDHVYGLFEEHERQRKAIETANMAIDTSVNAITDSFRDLREVARNAWDSLIFGAQAAGRQANDFLETQGEVFSALRNLGGVNIFNEQDFNQRPIRADLRRGPNVGRGRAEFRQRQGERIQEAVRGIGETSPDTTLTPLSDQRTREVFDPTARNRFNIPLSDEEALIPERPPPRSQRRQDLDRFLNILGENTYRQYGEDILLNLIGIGGRGERGLRDTLEDMREQFREVSAEINRDSSISARERFDELARLNENYQRQRRAVEKQYERDRERAHREFVAQVLSDFARLIYQQAQLRAAQRTTDFIFNQAGRLFGRGGGEQGIGFLSRLFGTGNAARGATQYASGIGPTASGVPQGTAAAGFGTSAAVAGVNIAAIATAVYGLRDPVTDLANSLGFHNPANDMRQLERARAASYRVSQQNALQKYGEKSAQDYIDNVTEGIAQGVLDAQSAAGGVDAEQPIEIVLNSHFNLGDKFVQTMTERQTVLFKGRRLPNPFN